MARKVTLEVKAGDLTRTLRGFFAELLTKGNLDALLIPLELPNKVNVVPTLVTEVEKLECAVLPAPVMPVNIARIISDMTKVTPSSKKVGVVLRNCEVRALIELVKLRQASLENMILFGIDCMGTYSVSDYSKKVEKGESPGEAIISRFKKGEEDPDLRQSCKICSYPLAQNADVVIELVSHDIEKEVGVTVATEKGEEGIKGIELKEDTDTEKREKAVEKMLLKQAKKREEYFKENSSRFQGIDKLMSVFSPCIRCYNCRTVCPACYCKECFFDSPTFEMEADSYLGWAESKGAVRMPNNTLFFHLTRMAHMATCCIGCGLCSEACPNDIPVAEAFQLAATEVQKDLEYVPGRSLDEELPLSSFREEELKEAED
ncbi:MAG: Coenzyme F420 hydrogenase/dehydrogenase, beta subunit C-terminal domain [Deltaproteobacteria bacterium]|nr:Coenzyme F420 hydrogenase/dehydrogenase, beta subunit C-terminal domain [Deltaproteobacteria bacterium]